ncbi:MAG: C40 family peptidase, partial [Oscillospiraceae bacterium]|nr:C40 family peptidase [Oscillospiraceae bacterium]
VASITPPPVVEVSVAESLPELSEPASESLDTPEPFGDGIGQKVADMARALIGTPFAENGATPDGFDNSGFIYYVLRENGYITCPRTTEAQSVMGAKLSGYNEMKPGDLVFFGTDDGGEAAFGGIFVGNGRMIACLSTSMDVCEVDITTQYYTSRFFGAISLS